MNWTQLITFAYKPEWADIGHHGNSHLYIYNNGKLELKPAKDEFNDDDGEADTHGQAFGQHINDLPKIPRGRIDHTQKAISLVGLSDRHNNLARRALSKKYPDYNIHDLTNWEALVSFNEDNDDRELEESNRYFNIGHTGKATLFRYLNGKLEYSKLQHGKKDNDYEIGATHGSLWDHNDDVKGRIDHNEKKISIVAKSRDNPMHQKMAQHVGKLLAKKYPDYQHEYFSSDNFATIENEHNWKIPYHINPDKEIISNLMDHSKHKYPYYPHLRGLLDHSTQKAYVWPAEGLTHERFIDSSGLNGHHLDQIHLIQNDESMPSYLKVPKGKAKLVMSSVDPNTTPNNYVYNHKWIKGLGMKHGDREINIKDNVGVF